MSQLFLFLIAIVFNYSFENYNVFELIIPEDDYFLIYTMVGLLTGVLIWLMVYSLSFLFYEVFNDIEQRLLLLPINKKNMLLIIILPAIIEEVFFRGLLQREIGIWWANLFFALGHIGLKKEFLYYGAITFIIGVVFSYVFIYFNNLMIPIIAHSTLNLLSVLRIMNKKRKKLLTKQ